MCFHAKDFIMHYFMHCICSQQSLEEMAAVRTGVKRIRSESGAVTTQSKKPRGEMYEKWKKKTHREIGGAGADESDLPRRRGSQRGKNGFEQERGVQRPKFSFNKGVKDELRSAAEIRKLQKTKEKSKLKNTEKGKRAFLEAKNKKAKKIATSSMKSLVEKNLKSQGRNRKSKLIVRY
jgi:hypothetical protein